jgi:hypothetical protein
MRWRTRSGWLRDVVRLPPTVTFRGRKQNRANRSKPTVALREQGELDQRHQLCTLPVTPQAS